MLAVNKPADPMSIRYAPGPWGWWWGSAPLNPPEAIASRATKIEEIFYKMERTKKIQIRLSPQELSEIKKKAEASGISASNLVRQSVTRVRAWTPENQSIQQEKIRQLARIGNNLNQIARAVNIQGVVTHELEILKKLAFIEDEITKALYPKGKN